MKYIIIPTAWLELRGIDTSDFRKSADESECIVHDKFVLPVLKEEENFPTYAFDSKELYAVLDSDKWREEVPNK